MTGNAEVVNISLFQRCIQRIVCDDWYREWQKPWVSEVLSEWMYIVDMGTATLGTHYGTGSTSEAQGARKAFLWSKYNWPVYAKTSNCSISDDLRPRPYSNLLLSLANLSSHAVHNKCSEFPDGIQHSKLSLPRPSFSVCVSNVSSLAISLLPSHCHQASRTKLCRTEHLAPGGLRQEYWCQF